LVVAKFSIYNTKSVAASFFPLAYHDILSEECFEEENYYRVERMRRVLAGLCVVVPIRLAAPLASQTARTQQISVYSEALDGRLEGRSAGSFQSRILPFISKNLSFGSVGAK
jgi:hypothetical protein